MKYFFQYKKQSLFFVNSGCFYKIKFYKCIINKHRKIYANRKYFLEKNTL